MTKPSRKPRLTNSEARRLYLASHRLLEPPCGPGRGSELNALISDLGFVQIDSVNTLARAHDLILFSRCPAYRPGNLKPLLERDRALFEQWTHDAAIIPTDFFAYWRLRFQRNRDRLRERWRNWQGGDFEQKFDAVLDHVSKYGPVSSSDVGHDEKRSNGGWWEWHPSKTALEYLWRTGALAVCRRDGFRKVYDLTERVIPASQLSCQFETAEIIDWACGSALDRLGFATSGELAAFWDLVTPAEALRWCADKLDSGDIVELETTLADGSTRLAYTRPDISSRLSLLCEPSRRIRILSPFDPAIRDRKRTERLFGFHFRIEIFVPESRRQYGYYVFPILEGETLIGRVDMKANRESGDLIVKALWPEPGVRFGKGRLKRLEAELGRIARFTGSRDICFEQDFLKV